MRVWGKESVQIVLSLLLATQALFAADDWQSRLVKINTETGKLTYNKDPESGIRIPDFSCAGYKGGGVPIPMVEVKETVQPITGDNTQHIQDVIDRVSKLPMDKDGLRGAVLLAPGKYEIHSSLQINAHGVVLRGSGRGEDLKTSTILLGVGNTPAYRSIIRMGGGQQTKFGGQVPGTKTDIVSDVVEVGDKEFRVANAAPYKVGDNIIIYHPCTQKWLDAIDGGGTGNDAPWEVDLLPIIFNTRISKISGDTIFTNSPLFNTLDRSLSQSYIYKYDREGVIENVGVENLRIDIQYPAWDKKQHAKNGIYICQAENSWVKTCKILHFYYAGVELQNCNYITVENVHATDPKGPIDGGYRYNFCANVAVQNSLFTKCKATKGRHHYVSNGTTSVAGLVFHQCESIDPYTGSEAGHRRWTMGVLFDQLRDHGRNPDRVLGLYNRGDWGTSHGWSSANSVAWNCDASREGDDGTIIVQRPPTAQNFAIGCKGNVTGSGPFSQPRGYTEGTNRDGDLIPASLYDAQLSWRLNMGNTAIKEGSHTLSQATAQVTLQKSGNKLRLNLGAQHVHVEVELFSLSGALVSKEQFYNKQHLEMTHTGASGLYIAQITIDGMKQFSYKIMFR